MRWSFLPKSRVYAAWMGGLFLPMWLSWSARGAAFDRMERTRDPSHTGALRDGEAERRFLQAGLFDLKTTTSSVDVELEEQLEASFPEPGDKGKAVNDGQGGYRCRRSRCRCKERLTAGSGFPVPPGCLLDGNGESAAFSAVFPKRGRDGIRSQGMGL